TKVLVRGPPHGGPLAFGACTSGCPPGLRLPVGFVLPAVDVTRQALEEVALAKLSPGRERSFEIAKQPLAHDADAVVIVESLARAVLARSAAARQCRRLESDLRTSPCDA